MNDMDATPNSGVPFRVTLRRSCGRDRSAARGRANELLLGCQFAGAESEFPFGTQSAALALVVFRSAREANCRSGAIVTRKFSSVEHEATAAALPISKLVMS